MEFIENYIENNKFAFRINYDSDFIKLNDASPSMKEHVIYLRDRINFFYDDQKIYELNPFSPMMVWANGDRSTAIEDLTSDDLTHLDIILNLTKDPILIGKINDILWVLRKDKKYAQKAAKCYIEFFENNKDENLYSIIMPLKRSLFLFSIIAREHDLISSINNLLDIENYQESDRRRIVYSYVTDFIITCVPKLAKDFITKIETVCLQDKENDDISLKLLEFLIKYYKSINNKACIKQYEFKYVEICKVINESRMPYGYEYLNKAIKILDDEYEEERDALRFQLEKTYAKLYDSFDSKPIPFSGKLVNHLNEAQAQIADKFKSLTSGIQQFLLLLREFNPISKASLQKELEKQTGIMSIDFCNNIKFDQNKQLVFESAKANEDDKLEYRTAQILDFNDNIKHDILLSPYIHNIVLDDELKKIIKEIISHNLFVTNDIVDLVYENIIICLQRNIRSGMFKLIVLFENGCRNFLKTKGIYPIMRKGSREDKINLNHMLVEKIGKTNKKRNAIKEILGEDLTLEIEYLACRRLSHNLRNTYYHNGCGDEKKYFPSEMVLFFYFLKAYCLGYDPDINQSR